MLALTWRFWHLRLYGNESSLLAWRIACVVLAADALSLFGAVATDRLRNLPIGALALLRIDVAIVVLEHALLAALLVEALRTGRPGDSLAALLTFILAQRSTALSLPYAAAFTIWCLTSGRPERASGRARRGVRQGRTKRIGPRAGSRAPPPPAAGCSAHAGPTPARPCC